jgi:hypothetical protein
VSEQHAAFRQPSAVAAAAASASPPPAAPALTDTFKHSLASTGMAAGAKTDGFGRDAQGNVRTSFHKSHVFKKPLDVVSLRLRS